MGRGPSDKDGKLSPKRQRFVDEYLIDFNGKQAAIRAGYSSNGAAKQAFELLKDPLVQAAVEEGRREVAQRTGITQDEVRRELKIIAFGNKTKDADKVRALQLLGQDLGMFKQEGVSVPITVVFDDPTERPEGYERKKHEKPDDGEVH